MRRARSAPVVDRNLLLDALRGIAIVWMTGFHFAFDLNHFGLIHQDFHRAPVWTVQRICILSLFLFCAGLGQAMAVQSGQTWMRFWRRWLPIAGCALAVSVGSSFMFPQSWIYFGVLHGIALMLLVCRATASWGVWLWLGGLGAIALAFIAPHLHAEWALSPVWDSKVLNWLGFISHKPITEDYVPLLPWLGVMWWGMATGQFLLASGWLARLSSVKGTQWVQALAWLGRRSLGWYMVHQPLLIGLLSAFVALR